MNNVENRKLFANRDARNRLAQMGGIMASSSELLGEAQMYAEGGNVGVDTYVAVIPGINENRPIRLTVDTLVRLQDSFPEIMQQSTVMDLETAVDSGINPSDIRPADAFVERQLSEQMPERAGAASAPVPGGDSRLSSIMSGIRDTLQDVAGVYSGRESSTALDGTPGASSVIEDAYRASTVDPNVTLSGPFDPRLNIDTSGLQLGSPFKAPFEPKFNTSGLQLGSSFKPPESSIMDVMDSSGISGVLSNVSRETFEPPIKLPGVLALAQMSDEEKATLFSGLGSRDPAPNIIKSSGRDSAESINQEFLDVPTPKLEFTESAPSVVDALIQARNSDAPVTSTSASLGPPPKIIDDSFRDVVGSRMPVAEGTPLSEPSDTTSTASIVADQEATIPDLNVSESSETYTPFDVSTGVPLSADATADLLLRQRLEQADEDQIREEDAEILQQRLERADEEQFRDAMYEKAQENDPALLRDPPPELLSGPDAIGNTMPVAKTGQEFLPVTGDDLTKYRGEAASMSGDNAVNSILNNISKEYAGRTGPEAGAAEIGPKDREASEIEAFSNMFKGNDKPKNVDVTRQDVEVQTPSAGTMRPRIRPENLNIVNKEVDNLIVDADNAAKNPKGAGSSVSVKDYETKFNELLGPMDKGKAKEKWHQMAMIGFAIAAGQSPDALTNIASGLLEGTKMAKLDRDEANKFNKEMAILQFTERNKDIRLDKQLAARSRIAAAGGSSSAKFGDSMFKSAYNQHYKENEDPAGALVAGNVARIMATNPDASVTTVDGHRYIIDSDGTNLQYLGKSKGTG